MRYINLADAYQAAKTFRFTEQNPYALTAISCSFAPDDACTIGTVGTFPYFLLNTERFTVPCGYVSVWDTQHDECEHNGVLFTYAVQPSPTFSQCGNIYCAVMNSSHEQISFVGYDDEEDDKYFESAPLTFLGGNLCGKSLCARVNENVAVTITNMKMQNDLDVCNFSVWKVKPDLRFRHIWTKKVDEVIGCSGMRLYLLDAAFSPDSKCFGMLMTNDWFILVNVHTRLREVYMNLGAMLNCAVKLFTFDPKFGHGIIAVTTPRGVYVVNIFKDGGEAMAIEMPSEEGGVINANFSKDGKLFAITLGNGSTLIYTTRSRYMITHVLCPSNCKDTFPTSFDFENVSANCVSFSSSSEEVTVAYSNGHVCIWQLPRRLSLKEICRMEVLCLYPMDLIDAMDIPQKLKRFLKFEPIFI